MISIARGRTTFGGFLFLRPTGIKPIRVSVHAFLARVRQARSYTSASCARFVAIADAAQAAAAVITAFLADAIGLAHTQIPHTHFLATTCSAQATAAVITAVLVDAIGLAHTQISHTHILATTCSARAAAAVISAFLAGAIGLAHTDVPFTHLLATTCSARAATAVITALLADALRRTWGREFDGERKGAGIPGIGGISDDEIGAGLEFKVSDDRSIGVGLGTGKLVARFTLPLKNIDGRVVDTREVKGDVSDRECGEIQSVDEVRRSGRVGVARARKVWETPGGVALLRVGPGKVTFGNWHAGVQNDWHLADFAEALREFDAVAVGAVSEPVQIVVDAVGAILRPS